MPPASTLRIQDKTLLEATFSRGIVRDSPRWAIPPGGVYDSLDFLLDRPGMAYKRGGSEFQSSALTGEALIVGVATPEFPNDPRVVAFASNGAAVRTLYDVTGTSAATGIDTNGAEPHENPPMYVDKLILCDGIGDGAGGNFYPPQKVYLSAGTVTVADLGGSPPAATLSCVHLSYLVLARTEANPNRLFFSPIPSIEATWDTTTAYIDVPTEITGLASINGVLLVFTRSDSWRILGNVPPGTTGENMELQPLASVGCIDARSIVKMNGLVYWAHESGVYFTNGAGIESITDIERSYGISALWTTAVSGFSPVLGSVVCAGVWLNTYLFLTVRHAVDDPQSGARYQFLYHDETKAWMRLSDGVTADMYATRNAPEGEIYAACGDPNVAVRLLKLSGIFSPTDVNSEDAGGNVVEPLLELRPFAAGPTLKAYGHGHVTLNAAPNSVDDSYQVLVATSPTLYPASFTTRETLTSQDGLIRKRFDTNLDSQAVTVRVSQTGPSGTLEVLMVEMEVRGYDDASEVT